MGLDGIRVEIERMRLQIRRQHKDIQALRHAGISSKSAKDLLERMQDKVDRLVLQRDEFIAKSDGNIPAPIKSSKARQRIAGRDG